MKKTDVKIGNQYTARIDGKLTIVEIMALHKCGGWKAKDVFTEKGILIPSGRSLRYPIHNTPYKLHF
jgi:hypothetical protein